MWFKLLNVYEKMINAFVILSTFVMFNKTVMNCRKSVAVWYETDSDVEFTKQATHWLSVRWICDTVSCLGMNFADARTKWKLEFERSANIFNIKFAKTVWYKCQRLRTTCCYVYCNSGRLTRRWKQDFDNYKIKWYTRCNNSVSYEFIWRRRTCDYI